MAENKGEQLVDDPLPALYLSESGSDEDGKGTQEEPFKTLLRVSRQRCSEPCVCLGMWGLAGNEGNW